MSEYKEKEFNKKLYNILNLIKIIEETLQLQEQINQLKKDDRRDNLAAEIFKKFKAEHQSKARQNKTSNNQEELPF